MSESGKRDAKSLVSSLLGGAPSSSAPTLPDDSPLANSPEGAALTKMAADFAKQAAEAQAAVNAAPPTPSTTDAENLITVYFELEEPGERDVVFDKLVAIDLPVVTDFLRAMMEEDEDEYVRAAAAAELARRGVPEAVGYLEEDVADPEEPYFFEQALTALARVKGPAFYDTVKALWRDGERDAEQRRIAMALMEEIDAARACSDFAAFIDAQVDIDELQDDQIELAMLAFARNGYAAAKGPLEKLHQRIASAELDADERDELMGFVQEGLGLLAEALEA